MKFWVTHVRHPLAGRRRGFPPWGRRVFKSQGFPLN